MSLIHAKLKLCQTKNHLDDGTPQYSLKYKVKSDHPRYASYAILSALAGESDLIIELNTDLFTTMSIKNQNCFQNFKDSVCTLDLYHQYKKFPSTQNLSVFGFVVDQKKKPEAQQMTVYIPNQVWKRDDFKDILPYCGARYYIVKAPMDEKIVQEIRDMTDEEKADTFKLIIFDLTLFGQMGIISKFLSLESLNALLMI